MIALQRPSNEAIREMLRSVSNMSYTFDRVGSLDGTTPAGFNRDAASVVVGHGSDTWEAAKEALRCWVMFPKELVSMVRLSDDIVAGGVVAVICKALVFWTINPARIISTVDSNVDGQHRFGFTYGTLPGHVESGEELFCVEWDERSGEVLYRLEAVSRPIHWLCRLGYPYTRHMQARFRDLSCKAVREFVADRQV